jgi:hypothetical protein
MNARDLTNQLAALLRRERHAMADFLLALADFDRRRLWIELGHASLFSFLRRELGLSAGAAQYRKTATELIQRHPEVEEALRSGKLCLSSLIELAKVVTPDNVSEVLPRFFGLSRREAADLAVSIHPVENPPSRDLVTAVQPAAALTTARLDQLPVRSPTEGAASQLRPAEPESAADYPRPAGTGIPAAAPRSTSVEKPCAVEPLDAERARLHITVSRRLLAKLEAAKAALSHSHPGASSEVIVEAALDLLLAQRAKRKGIVGKPRKTAAPTSSDAIPAAMKREVWTRARGSCEWPLDSGGVCGSTLRLELDHVTPRALGGPSTVANLRVLCRKHNDHAARQTFGDAWMDQYTRTARACAAPEVQHSSRSALSSSPGAGR